MSEKSRKELEHDLKIAHEAKLTAEDRLAGNRLAPLTNQLNEAETVYQELQEQHEQMVATRDIIATQLQEALSAGDDIDVLNEELSETNAIIANLTEEIDLNTSSIDSLQARIDETKTEYDVHVEELEMAQLNNEHTGLLERRLQVMESGFNEIVTELNGLKEDSHVLTAQLQEAIVARESVEYILEDVECNLTLVPSLETQLADLIESIEESSRTLGEHQSLIEELRHDIDNTNIEINADDAMVAEYVTEVDSLKEQLSNFEEPVVTVNDDLEKLLAKLDESTNYDDVYALEEDFNRIGMSIHQTTNNRLILCKSVNGKPVVENVLNDYIFIGDANKSDKRFTDGVVNKIIDFVKENAGQSSQCESEFIITIINEDKQFAIDSITEVELN